MAAKNITRNAEHPMFGKEGQKGTPPLWPGRKIIPFDSPASPPVTSSLPSSPPEPLAEDVCRFLEEELRQGKI